MQVSPMGPFTLGKILSETIGMYRRNAFGFLAIAAIVQIPLSMLTWLLFRSNAFPMEFPPQEIPTASVWIRYIFNSLAKSLLVGLAWILMQGALIHGISEQFLRRPIRIGGAYAFSLRRFFPRLGALILSGMALVLMWLTVLGIPFAIRYAGLWVFVLQTASVEECGPRSAMSRSAKLVRGSWSRVAGILFVSGILFGILGGIIGLLVGFIPVAGATIGTIITAPFLIIAHTLLYFDLRTQKDEAFNLEVLASDLRIEVEESPGS